MELRFILSFIRLSRPHFLLGGVLLYALGVGIARFLGWIIAWDLYFLGQAWVTSVQLGAHYLNEAFDAESDDNNPNRTIFTGGSGQLTDGNLPNKAPIWASVVVLSIAAVFSVFLIRSGHVQILTILIMGLISMGAVLYSIPPVRLVSSGYGELTTSVIVAILVPSFGFVLQTGELHRLIAMSTFPLIILHLAMMIAFEFPDYYQDTKYYKYTLLVRLGWEKGLHLHNILVMSSFFTIAIALVFGFPSVIALPTLLAFPIGLFQIWYLTRIGAGTKPNWTALSLTAFILFGVTAYLMTFSFWTR